MTIFFFILLKLNKHICKGLSTHFSISHRRTVLFRASESAEVGAVSDIQILFHTSCLQHARRVAVKCVQCSFSEILITFKEYINSFHVRDFRNFRLSAHDYFFF